MSVWDDARWRVATLTCLSFLLGSTGWLSWLQQLTTLADPSVVDVLTMVVGYLMQAIGIGAFVLVERRRKLAQVRRSVVASLVAYAICIAPATLTHDLAATLAFGYLANVLCGFAQGYYLFCLARFCDTSSRGIVFGSAYAASTLLSWLLSAFAAGVLTHGAMGLAVCVALALGASAIARAPIPLASDEDSPFGNDPLAQTAADSGLALWGLAAGVVVLMSLTKNAGFGFPSTDIVDGINLELSRLLYGAGLIVAGVVSDKNRHYGALCCAGALVTPFLMLALSGAAAPATLLWALNYLFFGFFSVFRVLLFADLSSASRTFALAGLGLLFGRVGDALGTGLYVVLAGHTLVLIVVAATVFAISLALLFVLDQKLYVPKVEPRLSEQEIFERFAARHDLSAREREVLRLVLAERSNSEIAGELFVSEATVKFHVRNLLKKTGCHNRREVMALYAGASQ